MQTPPPPRQWLVGGLIFAAPLVVFGLWEVGWDFARLPAWFYLYALAGSGLALLGAWLQSLDSPQRPVWQRVLLRGWGFLLPLMVVTTVGDLLSGEWKEPGTVAALLLSWGLVAGVYGVLSVFFRRRAEQGDPRAQKLREWL